MSSVSSDELKWLDSAYTCWNICWMLQTLWFQISLVIVIPWSVVIMISETPCRLWRCDVSLTRRKFVDNLSPSRTHINHYVSKSLITVFIIDILVYSISPGPVFSTWNLNNYWWCILGLLPLKIPPLLLQQCTIYLHMSLASSFSSAYILGKVLSFITAFFAIPDIHL